MTQYYLFNCLIFHPPHLRSGLHHLLLLLLLSFRLSLCQDMGILRTLLLLSMWLSLPLDVDARPGQQLVDVRLPVQQVPHQQVTEAEDGRVVGGVEAFLRIKKQIKICNLYVIIYGICI